MKLNYEKNNFSTPPFPERQKASTDLLRTYQPTKEVAHMEYHNRHPVKSLLTSPQGDDTSQKSPTMQHKAKSGINGTEISSCSIRAKTEGRI